MMTAIGIVSGKILTLFEDGVGPLTIEEIKSRLEEPVALIFMSLGWLVREGYIHMEEKNGVYLISLMSPYILCREKLDYGCCGLYV